MSAVEGEAGGALTAAVCAQDFIVREVSRAKEVVRLTDKSGRVSLPPDDRAVAPAGAPAAPVGAGAAGGTTGAGGGEGHDAPPAAGTSEGPEAPEHAAGVAEMEGLVGKELTSRIVALVHKAQTEAKSEAAADEDAKAWEVCVCVRARACDVPRAREAATDQRMMARMRTGARMRVGLGGAGSGC